MKNVFAAMVLVLLFVGSAAAFPCGSKHGEGGFGRNCGAPATSESKGQIIELRNLSEELRVELRKPVPDKVKAKALHGKILDITTEYFTYDGSSLVFTLIRDASSVIIVDINGLIEEENSGYIVSSSNSITLSAAPPIGSSVRVMYIY